MLLSSLPIGSKIKFGQLKLYASEPMEIHWLVAGINNTGQTANTVTLWTEQIIAPRCFDARDASGGSTTGDNDYIKSSVRQWLNTDKDGGQWFVKQTATDQPPDALHIAGANVYDTEPGFLRYFSDGEKALIQNSSVPVLKAESTASGSTITDKVFLPSVSELTGTNKFQLLAQTPSKLTGTITAQYASYEKITGKTANQAWHYITRDAYSSSGYVYEVNTTATVTNIVTTNANMGVRPCINLSINATVSDTPDTNGYYTVQAPIFINIDKTFEVKRQVTNNVTKDFNLKRIVTASKNKMFDTQRIITAQLIVDKLLDTKRILTNNVIKNFENRREIGVSFSRDFETLRVVENRIVVDKLLDTKRIVLVNENKLFNTIRKITANADVSFNLKRQVTNSIEEEYELKRKIIQSIQLDFETLRIVQDFKDIVIDFDLLRIIKDFSKSNKIFVLEKQTVKNAVGQSKTEYTEFKEIKGNTYPIKTMYTEIPIGVSDKASLLLITPEKKIESANAIKIGEKIYSIDLIIKYTMHTEVYLKEL